jgi:hypothetical protein
MNVSVIIPVYNAVAYVEEAVRSAVTQPQNKEVLLIEDGCPDIASLLICQRLAQGYQKVRLLQHPNGENRGAPASRNLGIENASCNFIAFLDADDFYLPNRFKIAGETFAENKGTEAVYEAIGTHIESDAAHKRWLQMEAPLLTTVKPGTLEKQMFEEQAPMGKEGHCHLDGLTVKRTVFKKTGLFDSKLRLHEDTVFFMKLAACAEIRLGEVEKPVAMRRVHAENRISRKRHPEAVWQDRLSIWLTVLGWFRQVKTYDAEFRTGLIINKMLYDLTSFQPGRHPLHRTIKIIRKAPYLLVEGRFVFGAAKRVMESKKR